MLTRNQSFSVTISIISNLKMEKDKWFMFKMTIKIINQNLNTAV